MATGELSGLSALLERIDGLKTGLAALEDEIKGLVQAREQEIMGLRQELETLRQELVLQQQAAPVVQATADEPPVDIAITDIDFEPVPEAIPSDLPSQSQEEAVEIIDDLPDVTVTAPRAAEDTEPEPIVTPELESVRATPGGDPDPTQRKAIIDTARADTAVMDVLAEQQAWRSDRPGSKVKNVISAISLNDRLLLINVLFKEDPVLFQETIAAFNGMDSLEEAVSFVNGKFPDWDLNSEPVYRLMMAVRRKIG